jgi:hypothetical protein
LPSQAVAVSCAEGAAFGDIDWKSGLITGEDADDLPAIGPGATYRAGAFVWCDMTDQDRADDLADLLRESAAGSPFCAALPWERALGDGSAGSRREARATLAMLSPIVDLDLDPLPPEGPRMLELYDRSVERWKGRPGFDLETATLYRTTLQPEQRPAAEASDALAIRLGRSPTASCQRIAIENVEVIDPDEAPSTDDPRRKPAGSPHTIRFAAKLARTADLDELGAYLCGAGCRVQILPWMPTDARLSLCF